MPRANDLHRVKKKNRKKEETIRNGGGEQTEVGVISYPENCSRVLNKRVCRRKG